MTAPLTLAALDAYRRIVTDADARPVVSVPLTPGDVLTLLDIAEDHARLQTECDDLRVQLQAQIGYAAQAGATIEELRADLAAARERIAKLERVLEASRAVSATDGCGNQELADLDAALAACEEPKP